jgi:hypothetical protein
MNANTARETISLYRPGRESDPKVMKAVQFAETHPDLQEELAAQKKFDEQLVGVIQFIRPPENLRERLAQISSDATDGKGRVRRNLFNPAILCALLGAALLVGFFVYQEMESSSDFPGRPWANDLIELNARMSGAELEPTNLTVADLTDNMMLRGFDGFAAAQEIRPLRAAGWRVFRHDGHKVAQILTEQNALLVFVCRASDFAMHPGRDGDWQLFSHAQWAAAATERNGLCTIITMRGIETDLKKVLDALKP